MCSYRKVKVGQLYRICPDMRSGCENANPPNGLRVSCAAVIDRAGARDQISFQNSHDLARRTAASATRAGWAAASIDRRNEHAPITLPGITWHTQAFG